MILHYKSFLYNLLVEWVEDTNLTETDQEIGMVTEDVRNPRPMYNNSNLSQIKKEEKLIIAVVEIRKVPVLIQKESSNKF